MDDLNVAQISWNGRVSQQMQQAELEYFVGSEAGRKTIAEKLGWSPLPAD